MSVGGAQIKMPAKFYLVAMFFVIFDVEAVFLYAWAVSVRQNGWTGFWMAALFVVVLLAALGYLWRVGGLEWGPDGKRVSSRSPALAGGQGRSPSGSGQIAAMDYTLTPRRSRPRPCAQAARRQSGG